MGNSSHTDQSFHDNNYHHPFRTEEISERSIPSSKSKRVHPRSATHAITSDKVSMRQAARIEHRHEKRYKTLFYVNIQYRHEATVPGIIYNISNNGMFILCNQIANIRRTVNICLPSYHKDGLEVVIPGYVVHRSSYGFGLMFRELDQVSQDVVNNLLAAVNTYA